MTDLIDPLFVSHGAPDLALTDTEAHRFLKSWAATAPRPRAILAVSAHFEALRPAVVTDPAPEMIYDFGGFDPRLRTLTYPSPGAPDVAERAFALLEAAGLQPVKLPRRGYDHGVWVPLMLLFPDADTPVAQLSVSPQADARWHHRLGAALRPLAREGVLVIGSGSLTHNLGEVFLPGGLRPRAGAIEPWVTEFAEWIAVRLEEGDVEALLDYRARAPFARENHPTDEHLLPLFVALGAAGEGASARRLHRSTEFGVLAMDAYRFAPAKAA